MKVLSCYGSPRSLNLLLCQITVFKETQESLMFIVSKFFSTKQDLERFILELNTVFGQNCAGS